jgi:large subunit ribosomal protein L20
LAAVPLVTQSKNQLLTLYQARKSYRQLIGTLDKKQKIMSRSVNVVAARARRKKTMKLAKGQFGRRKNVWTVAKNSLEKGMQYAYRDRKTKKRNFRNLWIVRINAGVRPYGLSYSVFMGKLQKKNIELNRKVLADLAMNHPEAFKAIVDFVK